jgi:hypothetical protein
MKTELKPCPFCGDSHLTSVDMTYMHADGQTKGQRIKCQTCGAQATDTTWNHRIIEQPVQAVPDAVLDDDVIRITIAEEFGIENGELGVWPDVRGLMKFARKIAMQTTPPQSDAREVERERLALENAMRVVALTERVAELEAMLGRWLPFGRADADGEIARFIVADTEAMLNAAPSAPMGDV